MACIAFVVCTELINTALEKLTDLVQPDFHPLAGQIKDVAAAAVLVASISAVVCASIVFVPYILHFFILPN
ncbi:MAG: diacylglycerol kinase family protein [Bacteroidota bacterium]